MNLLNALLGLVLNVLCTGEFIDVESVFLFEHNFWESNQKHMELDKGYLYSVRIKMQDQERCLFDLDWLKDIYFFDKVNKLNYIRIKETDLRDIAHFVKSKENDKSILRVEYFFTDVSFNEACRSGIDCDRTQWYKNFKIFKSTNKSVMEIINDEHNNNIMYHVDERFGCLLANELIKLNSKVSKGCLADFEEKPNFGLYQFKNYSDCLKGLKIFLTNLNYLILIDDTFDYSKDPYKEENILRLSFFTNYLNARFEESFENSNFKPHEKQYFKSFYHATCEYVKHELLFGKMILPLGGLYTIDYHLEQLYALIIETISKTQVNCINLIQRRTGYSNIQNISIQDPDEKSQKTTLHDLYDHNHILKYFSNYFNKEIVASEDFVKLEKVVCDYYNMVKYLSKMFNIQCSRENKSYTKPIYIDNYKCRIIEGIDIKFINYPASGKIKAFNSKGQEVLMIKGIDFFYSHKSSIFILFEKIEIKDIKEIEVISPKNKLIKRFGIEKKPSGEWKYLNLYSNNAFNF